MVLIRALVVLLAVSGCSQSLFGVHENRDGGSGGDDDGGASVPDHCPASSCIADAAANFDGSVDGTDGHWRYLGDRRDRTWAQMNPVSGGMNGDATNRIERCAPGSPIAACAGLPDALLVTSSGTSSASDPAIEYTAPQAKVIQLAVRAYIPGDSVQHRVRFYRNSREDVLFTASASPGATVEHTITVDAITGDRFLVALEPIGMQGGTAALHFFVIDAKTTFPSTCQLALTFEDNTVVGSTVDDLCRLGGFTYINGTMAGMPSRVPGPDAYHGLGLYFEPSLYLFGSQPLDKGDTTIQFWAQNFATTTTTTKAWMFSNIDVSANARGLGIDLQNPSGTPTGLKLEASFLSATTPPTYTGRSINFANDANWHFVRLVHTGGMVMFCVDGTWVMGAPLANTTVSSGVPYFGKNGPSDVTPEFNGALDDVRVFSDALPCNP